MSFFDLKNYRKLIRERIRQMPKQGYGVASKLAQGIGLDSTRLSRILSGELQLTPEQAYSVTEFFGFQFLEADYFIALVEFERAGTQSLKKYWDSKLEGIRARARDVRTQVKKDIELSKADQAIFYSSWQYSAVRLCAGLEKHHDIDSIATALGLTRKRTAEIFEFLFSTGLCVNSPQGIKRGPQSTFVEEGNEFALSHHRNWRQRALTSIESLGANELSYTAPLTLSKRDVPKFKELTLSFIKQLNEFLRASEPDEALGYIVLDFRLLV